MERTRFHHGNRGVSLVIMAVFLVVLMGMAALAVDLGMLQKARAEAQRAADAAALAGASAFLTGFDNAARGTEAIVRAKDLASRNTMGGTSVSVTEVGSCDPPAIPVDDDGVAPDEGPPDLTAQTCEVSIGVWYPGADVDHPPKVRVRVRRANVPMWFARVFGQDAFPVGARAAAVADYAGGVRCVRPITVMDLYNENSSAEDKNTNKVPEPAEIWDFDPPGDKDTYLKAAPDGSGHGFGSNFRNGYGSTWPKDRGLPMVLRAQGNSKTEGVCSSTRGNKCLGPGWWGLWDPWADESKENAQAGNIESALTPVLSGENCPEVKLDHPPGYGYKSGEVGQFAKDFEAILKADREATWCQTCTDPAGGTGRVDKSTKGADNWRASPRVWIMGIMDPYLADALARSGNTSGDRVQFVDFALFFFEGCATQTGALRPNNECKAQDDLWGRFIGIAPGTGPGTSTNSRLLRLVE